VFHINIAKVDPDVVYVAMAIHVASVYSKYFIYFRRTLQEFYLDVAVAIYIYCKCMFLMFHPFQTYVAKRMFQMFHPFQTYVAATVS
jgi:hypothetical protein